MPCWGPQCSHSLHSSSPPAGPRRELSFYVSLSQVYKMTPSRGGPRELHLWRSCAKWRAVEPLLLGALLKNRPHSLGQTIGALLEPGKRAQRVTAQMATFDQPKQLPNQPFAPQTWSLLNSTWRLPRSPTWTSARAQLCRGDSCRSLTHSDGLPPINLAHYLANSDRP